MVLRYQRRSHKIGERKEKTVTPMGSAKNLRPKPAVKATVAKSVLEKIFFILIYYKIDVLNTTVKIIRIWNR